MSEGLAHVPAQLDCRYSRHLRLNTKDLVRFSHATHIANRSWHEYRHLPVLY